MSLVLYNTLTKQKESFEPIKPGEVSMYVCGPTVYDLLHVGNFRGAIFFNLVRNWLEKKGLKVTYVYNYTDIDDKIIKKANDQGATTKDIAEKYIQEFEKDYNSLELRPHTHNPRATEYIGGMIEMIQSLIDNGKAYVAEDGEVLYSVESFDGYGKLSHKNLEDLQSGARVEISQKKRNPLDFVLWKPSKDGEPSWEAPWGDGRPGWHIECSVMSCKLLGESIDIHGGGIDLIFPHHENEIAQSEGASKKQFVKYWMHNNFINFGSEKMSKSLGNIITGRGFIEKYHPEILKYMILAAHYRTQSDFSKTQVNNAVAGLARFYSALSLATDAVAAESEIGELPKKMKTVFDDARKGIEEALDDDFNTPEVFARLFEVTRAFNNRYKKGQKVTPEIKAIATHYLDLMKDAGELLALFVQEPHEFLRELDDMLLVEKQVKREEVDELVAQRREARENKDYAKSDELRDKLNGIGIDVHDTPQGTTWEVKKS